MNVWYVLSPAWHDSATEILRFRTVGFRRSAGLYSDLRAYDPATNGWADLSAAASGAPPCARVFAGFASAAGKLYVSGGWNGSGALCARRGICFGEISGTHKASAPKRTLARVYSESTQFYTTNCYMSRYIPGEHVKH